jgi:AcrR family transcriptional regulator
MTEDVGGFVTPGRSLRRIPVQERSQARVNRMLDVCADIIDDLGYEGLTTTLLAERAGVAIGSVYQFFPDKRAVVQALTERNLAAYLDRLSSRIDELGLTRWWEAVDVGIDVYIEMHRSVRGFRTLHFGDRIDRNLLDATRDNNAVIAEHLRQVVLGGFPDLVDSEQLRFALALAVEVTDALTTMAFRRNPEGDERVLAECKDVVRDYLRRRVG